MHSIINFVEFENQIVLATYRNLMIGATVLLVDNESGRELPEPAVRIASPAPNGSVRIRLPAAFQSGTYCLRVLNGHAELIAQSVPFRIA